MPIRILHVVTKMDAAGIETLIMNFYRKIDREKVQFDFLTHRNTKGFYDDEILELGGRIFSVSPINPLKHKYYLSELDDFFSTHKYFIVHSHINTYSMYILRAAEKARVPVRIAHSHIANVPLDFKTPFRIYTKSKLCNYSNFNFACSSMAGHWLFGKENVSKDNFKIINNSIDASKYRYNNIVEKEVRDELGLADKFVISHIGRFNKQKNHGFIVDIFKEVVKKDPNSVLLLIGEGELETKIREKVINLGLQDKVMFLGVRSDVNRLLQGTDVFLFPSLYEGLGIVAVEAQAAGLPCVVSDMVPKEAFITDLITEIPLSSSAKEWSEVLFRFKGFPKKDTFTLIKDNGYDIIEQTKKLEEFYLELCT